MSAERAGEARSDAPGADVTSADAAGAGAGAARADAARADLPCADGAGADGAGADAAGAASCMRDRDKGTAGISQSCGISGSSCMMGGGMNVERFLEQ